MVIADARNVQVALNAAPISMANIDTASAPFRLALQPQIIRFALAANVVFALPVSRAGQVRILRRAAHEIAGFRNCVQEHRQNTGRAVGCDIEINLAHADDHAVSFHAPAVAAAVVARAPRVLVLALVAEVARGADALVLEAAVSAAAADAPVPKAVFVRDDPEVRLIVVGGDRGAVGTGGSDLAAASDHSECIHKALPAV